MSELHTVGTGQSESVLHEIDVSTSQYPHVIGLCGPGVGAVPPEIHLP